MRVDEFRRELHVALDTPASAAEEQLARVRTLARRQRGMRVVAAGALVAVLTTVLIAGVVAGRSDPERAIHVVAPPPTRQLRLTPGWHKISAPPYAQPFAAVSVGRRVIVAFGPGWLPARMQFAAYDTRDNSWARLPAPPLDLQSPFTVSGTFVWTGREVIVWGYQDGPSTDSFDGTMRAIAYNPATRGWRTLPRPPINGLIQATQVWTGHEMLVWGSNLNGPSTPLQSAAYSPTTNSWRTFPVGPLHPREDPVAVWTGHEMIVWGGLASPADSTDGAAFDPVTNTWRLLPPSGLSEREVESAAWTGREFVVWGGSSGSGGGADGARYDPATNRWQALPAAPIAGRQQASTARAGHSLVVWGGLTYSGGRKTFRDGASYDPVTNRWARLARAPLVSRWGAVAAWVDGRLLVVGGYGPAYVAPSGEPPVNDGAILVPRAAQTR